MPAPIPEALDAHDALAMAKTAQARSNLPRYLLSSVLAGAYVGVAVVLLIMTSGPLLASGHPLTKLVQGGVFGVALTLVMFAGAELFTGNNMVMLQGWLRRKVSATDTGIVWAASLVGNFVGSIGFAALVDATGVVTAGGTSAVPTVFQQALAGISDGKDGLTGGQLFFRAVLCNFLVCLALWMAARATSDAAKLLCLWWALLAFVASGFEHSIANMTVLGLGALTGAADWGMLFRNLVWTIPGNIVGGGLLVGLAYGWIGTPVKAAVPASTNGDVADDVALLPADPTAPAGAPALAEA